MGDPFILQALYSPLSPSPSPPPPGRKGEQTATFGHVFQGRKYTRRLALRQQFALSASLQCCSHFEASAQTSVYFPPQRTRPNVAVGSLFRPAGRERAGGVSGGKNVKNPNPIKASTQASRRPKGCVISTSAPTRRNSPTSRRVPTPRSTICQG